MSSVESLESTDCVICPTRWWINWGIPGGIVLMFLIFAVTISLTRHHIGDYGVETDFYWDYAPAADALLHGELPIERYSFRGPGYPLVLALIKALVGDSFLAGKLISLVSAATALLLSYFLLKRGLDPILSAVGVVFIAMNGVFLEYTIRAGTDMFFMALNLLFFFLFDANGSGKRMLWCGVIAGYAFLTRYNGAALILMMTIWAVLVLYRDRRTNLSTILLAGLGVALVVSPWLLVLYAKTGSPFFNLNSANILYELTSAGKTPWDQFWYADHDQLSTLMPIGFTEKALLYLSVFARNILHYFVDIGEQVTGRILFYLALVGMVLAFFKRMKITEWRWMIVAGLLHFFVLCTVFFSERFYLLLMPIVVGLALSFLNLLLKQKENGKLRKRSSVVLLAIVCIFIVGSPKSWELVIQRLNNDPVEILDFIARPELSQIKEERITARKPHFAYLTGNKFFPLPLVKNFDELITWMRQEHISYIFLDEQGANTRPVLWSLLGAPHSRQDFQLIAYSTTPPIGFWEFHPDRQATVP